MNDRACGGAGTRAVEWRGESGRQVESGQWWWWWCGRDGDDGGAKWCVDNGMVVRMADQWRNKNNDDERRAVVVVVLVV